MRHAFPAFVMLTGKQTCISLSPDACDCLFDLFYYNILLQWSDWLYIHPLLREAVFPINCAQLCLKSLVFVALN